MGFLQAVLTGAGFDDQVIDRHRTRLAVAVLDLGLKSLYYGARGCSSASRKLATRSSVARQSAMVLKLSTNQRNDDGACVNAAAAIIRPPKEILPVKHSGAATRMVCETRSPSQTRRHPGEVGQAGDEPAGGGQHIAEMRSRRAAVSSASPAARVMSSRCSLTRTRATRRSASRA